MTIRDLIVCNPEQITSSVSADGKSITFQPCGVMTNNPSDVKSRYCPRCYRFMELVEFAAALRKTMGGS